MEHFIEWLASRPQQKNTPNMAGRVAQTVKPAYNYYIEGLPFSRIIHHNMKKYISTTVPLLPPERKQTILSPML
jgi:hypothetical protein